MKIIIAGDYAPVRRRLKEQIDNGRYSEILGHVKPILSAVDLAILNFETPIANPCATKPIIKYGPNLYTVPNAMTALKWAGFNLITLANNHILDYGEIGLSNVLKEADKNAIKTVGAGKDIESASQPFIYSSKNVKIAIINCCEHEFSIASENSGGANPLNPINQFYAIKEAKQQADFVFVITHGGHEHFQLPSLRMQQTYRFFIDAGADLVVNHHQHCYSGYEEYNGKRIYYGLGNFCFDTYGAENRPLWTSGFLLDIEINQGKLNYKEIPLCQYSETPTVEILTNTKDFFESFNQLSKTISSPTLLKEKLEEYYSSSCKSILSLMEPYSSRITKALYSRGLLPTTLKGRKIPIAMNIIDCESHLDKLKYALCQKMKSL